jgi:hypothetical protein
MMKSTKLLLAAMLLSTLSPSRATEASEMAQPERQTVGASMQEEMLVPNPVTETIRGAVDSVDEGNDTIKLRLSSDSTQLFKVQDGLIFNAVRFGDQVKVTVQDIAGAKTIIDLSKE